MKHITVRNRAISILDDFFKTKKIVKKLLVPSNICFVVPLVLKKNNIEFTFLDISKKDLNMNKEHIIDLVKKFDGMIWFNTYGNERKNSNFFKECKSINRDFIIIDDKCLNKPEININKNSQSDLELYSTGYAKYCDLGYGGFSLTKDKIKLHKVKYSDDNYNKILINIRNSIKFKKKFKMHYKNWLKKEFVENEKKYFQNIKNSLIKIKLHKLKINKIYNEILPNELKLGEEFNSWRYNIIISKKEELLKKIFNYNLFASSHYYPSSKIFKLEKQKNTDLLNNSIINLFNDFRYNEEMAEKTAKIIKKHFLIFGNKRYK